MGKVFEIVGSVMAGAAVGAGCTAAMSVADAYELEEEMLDGVERDIDGRLLLR